MAKQPVSRSGSKGRLSGKPAPEDGLVPKTLEFIYNQLSAWRDDPKRPHDPAEKSLNSTLCDFLDRRSRVDLPMVRFKHEAQQSHLRSADLGVHGMGDATLVGLYSYTPYEPFMVIEAKRLPAPSSDREREYVSGVNKSNGSPTGGIQRFKLGLHGADIETAAIVGYVQEQPVQNWFEQINQWITDLVTTTESDGCVWSAAEKLQALDCDEPHQTARTSSVHQRSGSTLTSQIRLHHFWVVMGFEK
jgi:hypothetical protein